MLRSAGSLRLLILGSLITVLIGLTVAQPGPGNCPVLVERALAELEGNCDGLDRNTACYGYNLVRASFAEDIDPETFRAPADRADLSSLASIATAPLDLESDTWGLAMLSVHANVPATLPGQSVKFVLMGDAEVVNAVTEGATFMPVDPIPVTVAVNVANIRSGPGTNFNVLEQVNRGTVLDADGVDAGGTWLRVLVDTRSMWISTTVLEPVETDGLPQVDGNRATPMQAFYFTTGLGSASCVEAPDMLVVQGPDEVVVDLTVNGAKVGVGSTLLLRNVAGDVGDYLNNLPPSTVQRLQDENLSAEERCRLSRIYVARGELELNNGALTLPEGNTALNVVCDFSDPQDEDKPPEIITSDFSDPEPFTEEEFAQIETVEEIPGKLLNYRVDMAFDGAEPAQEATEEATRPADRPGRGELTPEATPELGQGDRDGDGIINLRDNCPGTPNRNQRDRDRDERGDACDPDDDNDGVLDVRDNCPAIPNPNQNDRDRDERGDACDPDDDNDGVLDVRDNCPIVPNPRQIDSDDNGVGDRCEAERDRDSDGDGVLDVEDNCPNVPNPDQADADRDGVGDACEGPTGDETKPGTVPVVDSDGDGVADAIDNCRTVANSNQGDQDGDGIGNACDPTPTGDMDGDGMDNAVDNCRTVANANQGDQDGDGIGNVCDPTPTGDMDGDGVDNAVDNCRTVANAGQADNDGDGVGNACDPTPNGDQDGDGVDNAVDNCRTVANPGQADGDGDGIGNVCDPDADGDGVPNGSDNCPTTPNPGQRDTDGDGKGDACDPG